MGSREKDLDIEAWETLTGNYHLRNFATLANRIHVIV